MGSTAASVIVILCMASAGVEVEANRDYSNIWVAQIRGGEEVAVRIAKELGYNYKGKVSEFYNDYYVMTRDDHPQVSKRNSLHLTRSLTDRDEVLYAAQQPIVQHAPAALSNRKSKKKIVAKIGEIEGKVDPQDSGYKDKVPGKVTQIGNGATPGGGTPQPAGKVGQDSTSFKSGTGETEQSIAETIKARRPTVDPLIQAMQKLNIPAINKLLERCKGKADVYTCLHLPPNLVNFLTEKAQKNIDKVGSFSTDPAPASQLKTYRGPTKHTSMRSSRLSAYAFDYTDPLWRRQWYMHDYRTKEGPVMDHNIVPVLRSGITGKGVTVAVVDDGLFGLMPDIVDNYAEDLSFNFCDNVPGSMPQISNNYVPSHGTNCAGVIAMKPNNEFCGVGAAYGVKIAGLLLLCAYATPLMEMQALSYKLESNTYDIYSNSWGPLDNGLNMVTMDRLTNTALLDGSTKGRNGKGAIYMFAVGNGRSRFNNCAYNPYPNHIGTIGIAAVGQDGKPAPYSERCTAVVAAAYSKGSMLTEGVSTIDPVGMCTLQFDGTSAATPLASAMIALLLEANPELTQRCVLHIIAWSAEVAPLADNPDSWQKNGRGLWVSADFGFGLLNMENMVNLAKDWEKVPDQAICTVSIDLEEPLYFSFRHKAVIPFETKACEGSATDTVNYLEQIQLTSNIQFPFRGAVSIKITSPAKTSYEILEYRLNDNNPDGFNGWTIKSVHNWGEDPKGQWTIEVNAHPLTLIRGNKGYVSRFVLSFYGTADKPSHYDKKRVYAAFRLPNGKTSES